MTPGTEIIIQASWTAFAGGPLAVGRFLAFGRQSRPERASDLWPPVVVEIVAHLSAQAARVKIIRAPEGGVPAFWQMLATGDWALMATTVSVGAHLDGQTCGLWLDGADAGTAMPSGGTVALPYPAARATVGLPIVAELETLDLTPAGPNATKGKRVRPSEATITLQDSQGGEAAGNQGKFFPLPSRVAGDAFGAPPRLFSGDKTVPLAADAKEGARAAIRHATPGPFAVLSVSVETSHG